ncbi:arsenate-mycothiol transferase ArsC [Halostagnicola bangensis]
MSADPVRIGFVCVQNAGRSQMATAYAERERDRRNLEDDVEIRSGGTHPADSVHDIVLEAMAEEGIDLAQREPREISEAELESCAYVATMGCSTLEIDAETDVRDWDLPDPHGRALEEVHEIRQEVRRRVGDLFDELEKAELR